MVDAQEHLLAQIFCHIGLPRQAEQKATDRLLPLAQQFLERRGIAPLPALD